eukprot:scaffold4735_cov403-Prasinococcus_capsulatus_cf.AAC.1
MPVIADAMPCAKGPARAQEVWAPSARPRPSARGVGPAAGRKPACLFNPQRPASCRRAPRRSNAPGGAARAAR